MLKDFFVNLSIISFFILLGGYFLRDKYIGDNKNDLKVKMIVGTICGVLGVLCMIYTIETIRGNTIVDLRVIALMISFYVGGKLSLSLASIITVVGRIMLNGLNESSIIATLMIGSLLLALLILDKSNLVKLKKWTTMHIIAMSIYVSGYYYLLKSDKAAGEIIFSFLLLATISSFLVFKLIEYVKTMNESYNELKHNSTVDFLTGLNNRREMDKRLSMYQYNSDLNKEDLACIMVDIDHFKRVNDTYGHAAGDKILKQLSKILKENCRGKDLVSRFGGEEFCILLPDCNIDCAKEVANRILKEVRRHHFKIDNDKFINITISAGISIYPHDAKSTELMLHIADKALYSAKEGGRDRVNARLS